MFVKIYESIFLLTAFFGTILLWETIGKIELGIICLNSRFHSILCTIEIISGTSRGCKFLPTIVASYPYSLPQRVREPPEKHPYWTGQMHHEQQAWYQSVFVDARKCCTWRHHHVQPDHSGLQCRNAARSAIEIDHLGQCTPCDRREPYDDGNFDIDWILIVIGARLHSDDIETTGFLAQCYSAASLPFPITLLFPTIYHQQAHYGIDRDLRFQ